MVSGHFFAHGMAVREFRSPVSVRYLQRELRIVPRRSEHLEIHGTPRPLRIASPQKTEASVTGAGAAPIDVTERAR